jgi:hypothetical protein
MSVFRVLSPVKIPSERFLSKSDKEVIVRRLGMNPEPDTINEFQKIDAGKRVKSWSIPRAIGLWLWDERQKLKSPTEAVNFFLDEYEDDERLLKSYRNKSRNKNLFTLLSRTDESIRKLKIISFSN